MTRKDYILLAAAIKATADRIGDTSQELRPDIQLRGVRRTAAHIADALAKDNPRFDAGRFLSACGYGADKVRRNYRLVSKPLEGIRTEEVTYEILD